MSTKAIDPEPDRFPADNHTPRSQQVFNASRANNKKMITPTATTPPSLQTGQSNQQLQSPQPTGLELNASRQFTSRLAEIGGSFAFSTCQVGKLLFIGLKNDGSLSLFNHTFSRCMGLGAHNISTPCHWFHWREGISYEERSDDTFH